jgi:hypothetical protein
METAASYEARSAPSLYPTAGPKKTAKDHLQPVVLSSTRTQIRNRGNHNRVLILWIDVSHGPTKPNIRQRLPQHLPALYLPR